MAKAKKRSRSAPELPFRHLFLVVTILASGMALWKWSSLLDLVVEEDSVTAVAQEGSTRTTMTARIPQQPPVPAAATTTTAALNKRNVTTTGINPAALPLQMPPPRPVVGRDICIEGGFFGRTFNQIRTLGNAITTAQNVSQSSVVRLNKTWMNMYREWFELQNGHRLVEPWAKEDKTLCLRTDTAADHFSGRLLPTQNKKLYQPGIGLLWSHFKREHVQQAKQALASYRGSATTTVVVTVHLRGLEGACGERARDGRNICPVHAVGDWSVACDYTQDFVRQQLPAEERETAVIVALGDQQNQRAQASFDNVDRHVFPVQAALMVLSDYHFGNPMSTVDTVVAHWRMGRRQYPDDCYRDIVQTAAAHAKTLSAVAQ